jgi:predicted small metal-binding protein
MDRWCAMGGRGRWRCRWRCRWAVVAQEAQEVAEAAEAEAEEGEGGARSSLPEWASTHPTHEHRCEDIREDFIIDALAARRACGCPPL